MKEVGKVVGNNALRHISHLISKLVTIDRFPNFDAEPIVHWPAIRAVGNENPFKHIFYTRLITNPKFIYTYMDDAHTIVVNTICG